MPLYELTEHAFRPLGETTFSDIKVKERGDLQRLLRTQIDVLGDDLYVLAEEFSDWEDSDRRIDLLAIDKQANLVVIELKRTNDGGHMELQAIRYASMVSAMTFARAVEIHGRFLAARGEPAEQAQDRLLGFLGWDDPDEEAFADDVRILLVSMNFSKELTTAVLWLRDRDIDIRCIRLRPYADGERNLIDIQQVIPLPEAAEYQVQLRAKDQIERQSRAERHDFYRRFWQGFVSVARLKGTRYGSMSPGSYHYISSSSGVRGVNFNFVIVQEHANAEVYIDRGSVNDNKRIFDFLLGEKAAIERAFGADLSWERLDAKRACRIKFVVQRGGYRNPETEWPAIQGELVEAMTKLEASIRPYLPKLPIHEGQ